MSEIPDQNTLINNTLALNLALQTIKERCLHLQRRLAALESENSRLRLSQTTDKKSDNSLSEIEELRAKNAEITTQKNQLAENLNMISIENRKLWKRLSQLTKDGNSSDEQRGEASTPNDVVLTSSKANQNLIRSKTFTQSSPHQLLKEKLIGHQIGPEEDELEDISLLKDCDFIAEKMNFGEDNETCDADSKACVEGLANIKRELLKQNSDLKVALSNCRKLKAIETCSCKTRKDAKPAMVDKNINTDVELTIELYPDDNLPDTNSKLDVMIIEQKKAADLNEKICPMCGKFYATNILFEEFQDHVESHFRDDSDIESHSLENNFELVSHSVGNF